jgi:hypothetical protein
MTHQYVQIVDETVVNIVLADDAWAELQGGEWIKYDTGELLGISWRRIDGVFVAPEVVPLAIVSLDESATPPESDTPEE